MARRSLRQKKREGIERGEAVEWNSRVIYDQGTNKYYASVPIAGTPPDAKGATSLLLLHDNIEFRDDDTGDDMTRPALREVVREVAPGTGEHGIREVGRVHTHQKKFEGQRGADEPSEADRTMAEGSESIWFLIVTPREEVITHRGKDGDEQLLFNEVSVAKEKLEWAKRWLSVDSHRSALTVIQQRAINTRNRKPKD